jgi:hypothetical protein
MTGLLCRESAFRGWQLLCVLLVTFPPSKNFEPYLHAFLSQHRGITQGRIDVLAKHCLKRLSAIAKKGPRGKPPSLAEIETASVRPLFLIVLIYRLEVVFTGRGVQSLNVRRASRRCVPSPGTHVSVAESADRTPLPR